MVESAALEMRYAGNGIGGSNPPVSAMKIQTIGAREILDSRGNPTLEADVILDSGILGRAAVPSGASTGAHEAHELRDGDLGRYAGKGVLNAAANIRGEIARALAGKDVSDQGAIDRALVDLDGTENKSRLGANATLAVSLAAARAAALALNIPLYRHIYGLSGKERGMVLPLPLCNVINGGRHAFGSTDIQEFMIVPVGAPTFREAVRVMAEVFHALGGVLKKKGYGTTVGDEGGYAPSVAGGNAEALELLSEAARSAGYELGKDIVFALDAAASEFFQNGKYELGREGKTMSSEEMISWYAELQKKYPIVSIEDGLCEEDWKGWVAMTERLGARTQLVGDDLLVTNTAFLERGIRERAGNAILIKVNQIGTLTETMAAVRMAHAAGWRAIISHRSGETEDAFISHLAVGLGAGQIKTGSVSRGERTAKYNELLRIEEEMGDAATLWHYSF